MENEQAAAMAMAGIGLVGALIIAVIMLIPVIFYLLTVQKALTRCSPESRAMSPGLVWLMLIPLFNLVWHFFLVLNTAKSLGAEFKKRGIAGPESPGKGIGLAMAILPLVSWVPIVGAFAGIGYLVCWIIYWVKIAGFSKQIAQPA